MLQRRKQKLSALQPTSDLYIERSEIGLRVLIFYSDIRTASKCVEQKKRFKRWQLRTITKLLRVDKVLKKKLIVEQSVADNYSSSNEKAKRDATKPNITVIKSNNIRRNLSNSRQKR